MHPSLGLGSNPACNLTTLSNCAPTYGQLKDANALWSCPRGEAKQGTCGFGSCVESLAGGGNPLCGGQLNDSAPCCCPKKGCYTEPLYNTVIGVCKGTGCACGDSTAPSCAPQGNPEQCGGSVNGTQCTGRLVRCCFGANVEDLVPFYNLGTQAVLNYWAAYQYDVTSNEWVIQEESSFNTNASQPPFNLTAPHGGLADPSLAWLAPQPGGSAFWSAGFYPAGVRGVGAPGVMFVMSTEQWWGGTWYMLNQLSIDRGPASQIPVDTCPGGVNDNCWAAGNAGEMDFLETGWNLRDVQKSDPGYRRSFSTQYNQIGRCFNGGVNGGGFTSPNYLETSPATMDTHAPDASAIPFLYVAVVDSVGNWVYRIPADAASEIWPGPRARPHACPNLARVQASLTPCCLALWVYVCRDHRSLWLESRRAGLGRKTAAARVRGAPTRTPNTMNPCNSSTDGHGGAATGFCAVFTSNCQATNVTDARKQGCGFNGDQGWCGNIWASFADTKQPLFPNASCVRDVRGGDVMPWCREMVNLPSSPPPMPPSPTPAPAGKGCMACTAAQCIGEGCGESAPYMCLAGPAHGGCASDPAYWPKSGACNSCCDSTSCAVPR